MKLHVTFNTADRKHWIAYSYGEFASKLYGEFEFIKVQADGWIRCRKDGVFHDASVTLSEGVSTKAVQRKVLENSLHSHRQKKRVVKANKQYLSLLKQGAG